MLDILQNNSQNSFPKKYRKEHRKWHYFFYFFLQNQKAALLRQTAPQNIF